MHYYTPPCIRSTPLEQCVNITLGVLAIRMYCPRDVNKWTAVALYEGSLLGTASDLDDSFRDCLKRVRTNWAPVMQARWLASQLAHVIAMQQRVEAAPVPPADVKLRVKTLTHTRCVLERAVAAAEIAHETAAARKAKQQCG